MSWRLQREPRAWQLAAFRSWRAANRRGIAAVVTGAGKTVFAEMCIADVHEALDSVTTLIVVPTLALVDQWVVSLEEDLGVAPAEIAVVSGATKDPAARPIVVTTLNTARSLARDVARKRPTFLVVDECHRVGSPVNSKILENEYVATLGLSATPEREYDDAFEEAIVPALGEIILRYDYRQAARDKVIVPFEIVNVGVNLTESEQEHYDDLTRQIGRLMKQGEEAEHRLEQVLRARARLAASAVMRIPVSVKIVDAHRGARVIVFHEQIAAAEQIAPALWRRGHNAALYHSQLGEAIRTENLRLYRNGVFDVLITCRAIDEGVNVPETTVGIIASSTASNRQRIQRLGRILRPAPGKDVARVYTLYATEVEQRRLASEDASDIGAASVHWMSATMEMR